MLAIPIVSIPVMIAFPAALGVYWVSIASLFIYTQTLWVYWVSIASRRSILKRDYNMSSQVGFTVFVSFLHHEMTYKTWTT